MGKPYNKDGPSAEDKALDFFCDMMIEKIQSMNGKDGWQKPWFTEGTLQWPKNLNGREYNGMNALLLLMHCEKNGYQIPRFCTFDCVQRLNKPTDKQAKDGVELPRVLVNRGEKSFPVMLTTFTCIHKETKEKIKYDDLKNLSEEEKKMYNIFPKLQVFRVFNVSQTNLQEARPKLWAKLEAENKRPEMDKGEQFSFEPVDTLIRDNSWICPIKPTYGDQAYFSISKNEIVVPEKKQFKDGESFYSNLFHEMGHSTGHESALDRLKPATFGSADYAREELVAELTAALTAQRYGMTKNLKEDSAAYLHSWLDSLKESPQFIKTTLVDVKKASSMITQQIDRIAEQLEQAKEASVKVNEKPFYASVAYLQMPDDTQSLETLREESNYEQLLQEAKEYDQGDAVDLEHTYKSPKQNCGDDLLIEDADYAVVYNSSVGGTYEIMRRVSEQEVQQNINRYGLPSEASNDVKDVAKSSVAAEFEQMTAQRMPVIETESGAVLYVQYNKENDSLEAGFPTNAGLTVKHSFAYYHDHSLDSNIQGLNERISEMQEYQKEPEEEQVVARSAFRR